MLEEEKTDSESSCLLFEKEKRLPERMNYACGENGLGKQLSPLRKKENRLSERMELCMQKLCLEIFHQPRKGSTQNENYIFIPFLRFFPSPSGRSGQNDEEGFIICGEKGWIRTTRNILADK